MDETEARLNRFFGLYLLPPDLIFHGTGEIDDVSCNAFVKRWTYLRPTFNEKKKFDPTLTFSSFASLRFSRLFSPSFLPRTRVYFPASFSLNRYSFHRRISRCNNKRVVIRNKIDRISFIVAFQASRTSFRLLFLLSLNVPIVSRGYFIADIKFPSWFRGNKQFERIRGLPLPPSKPIISVIIFYTISFGVHG